MSGFKDRIKIIFSEDGIELDDLACDRFESYYQMLIEKNKVMNLTAITDRRDVMVKHFLDSCILGKYFSLNTDMRIADIGCGAGFPGLALKIAFPYLNITLVDSLKKRLDFLDDVILALKLEGVVTVHSRAEDFSHKKDYRESYDLVLSRAVANLSTLYEYCLPAVKVGGSFIAYKSADIENEINASKKSLKLLGGNLQTVHKFSFYSDEEIFRSFVIIMKEKATPGKYPRKAGTPARFPL